MGRGKQIQENMFIKLFISCQIIVIPKLNLNYGNLIPCIISISHKVSESIVLSNPFLLVHSDAGLVDADIGLIFIHTQKSARFETLGLCFRGLR